MKIPRKEMKIMRKESKSTENHQRLDDKEESPRSQMGRLLKENQPEMIFVVVGCLALGLGEGLPSIMLRSSGVMAIHHVDALHTKINV